MLGRNPVDPFGPNPHEVDSTARDDVVFKSVGPQVHKDFLHGLIGQLIVPLGKFRMHRAAHPLRYTLVELLDAHAGMGHPKDLQESLMPLAGQEGWDVSVQDGLDHRMLGEL